MKTSVMRTGCRNAADSGIDRPRLRPAHLVLYVALLLSLPARAADFSGRWMSETQPAGAVVEMELRQNVDWIEGVLRIGRQFRIAPSRVTGASAALELLAPVKGRLAPLPASVKIEGDILRVQLPGGRELVLRRAVPSTERSQRIAGLMRAWGTILFFHPYLAHHRVDWDGALIDALPAAERATDAAGYAAAVTRMLVALGDPATRLLPSAGPPEPASELAWREGVAILTVGEESSLRRLLPGLQKASRLVIDLRRSQNAAATARLAEELVAGDVPLPAVRHVLRSGFYPDHNGANKEPYYWDWDRCEIETLRGHAGTNKPLVFLIGPESQAPFAVLAGLQQAGRAVVAQDGAFNLECAEPFTMQMPYGLRLVVRGGELISGGGELGFHPDLMGGLDAAVAAAVSLPAHRSPAAEPDLPRSPASYEEGFPDRPMRLLTLAKFWNTIRYFFPYHELMERPWDTALERHLEEFENAANPAGYLRTVRRLAAELQDSHVVVHAFAIMKDVGLLPSAKVEFVENQPVFTSVDGGSGLAPGDVILSIDGTGADERRRELLSLFSHSTPQAGLRVAAALFLRGRNPDVLVEVKKPGGRHVTVALPRTLEWVDGTRSGEGFRNLEKGIVYLDPSRFDASTIRPVIDNLASAPGLILDLRQGDTLLEELMDYLTVPRAPFAEIEVVDWHGPDPARKVRDHYLQYTPGGDHYRGKIAVLIDAQVQSHLEHYCLELESNPRATFIGSPTAGANGNISAVVLPGGMWVNFSGEAVRHGDGRQLQRVGIQPNIPVEPTLEAVRQGRDLALERAIRYLSDSER